MASGSKAPRWKLDTVYPGYESAEYRRDRAELVKASRALITKLNDSVSKKKTPEKWLTYLLKKIDSAYALYANLESYIYCRYATDTRDEETLAELNSMEEDVLQLKEAEVTLRNELFGLRKQLPGLYKASKTAERFRFYLNEQLLLQSRQMSPAEENLAADLSRAGGDAWGRLQETVSSNLSVPWKGDETKTVVELRSLAMHKDRTVRQKAYEKELDAWKSMEIPLAAALNGVKGFAVILDERRHYESSLDHAALLSRISPKALDALIGVMEKNLPVFRRYLKAKAKLIGVSRCAFYDLFAPVDATGKEWSFADARKFIVGQFNTFSSELGDFAESAFKQGWIDARPRKGKVGGAFCTFMPLAGESRILANFDGSFDSVATIAHELGHAYHGSVMKDLPALHQDYPMTLAETASIFCETIVFNRALDSAENDGERIGVLELFLQGATAVIVDILSRFKFEKAVFERRKAGDLSPAEFSDLMIQAQMDTYGDGLDKKQLHKYMWAVKSHYYSADLSFYNYPYAFGLLLGLSLYANYTTEPQGFPNRYKKLLQQTGQATAGEVTRGAGFDIESAEFWQSGIDVIARRVSEFSKLVTKATR
ncbi:MAG: M3 family oligoendopeptidase [Spirochaetales bacterium]|nr:M3 family oligoendopeptidase [Spirochaetales bacterium]